MTGCYQVELTNRFTGALKMIITDVQQGKRFAVEINQMLTQMRGGRIN